MTGPRVAGLVLGALADAVLGDGNGQDDEEEEQGVTRCICQESGACSGSLQGVCMRVANAALQASTRRVASLWLNARSAMRGSMGHAWGISPLKRCHCTTTANAASPRTTSTSSSACLASSLFHFSDSVSLTEK